MEGIVYICTNIVNNKQYIGQTTKMLKERVEEHKRLNGCLAIHSAIKKYGVENFKWVPIEYPVEELNDMETFWIKTLDTKTPRGYNLTNGGDGGDTFTHNPKKEEIREKSGNASIKYWREHPEKKEEKSTKWKGEKNPRFGKGYLLTGKNNPMHLYDIDFSGKNNPFYGKKHTEESKKIMSEKAKKRKIGVIKND